MATNPDIETDIPRDVYQFFRGLNRAVERRDAAAMHDLYESQFDALTKNYYMAGHGQFRSWPALRLEQVSSCFRGNRMAELVYSFLFYKHLFMDNRSVRAPDAEGAWKTYSELLPMLKSYELPNWMLWDIFDEFLYQMTVVYQKVFATEGIWAVPEVSRLLNEVVDNSRLLELVKEPDFLDDIHRGPNTGALSGFYAIVTKSKLNVLLGDYYSALTDLEPLDVYNKGRAVLTRVSPCAVSVFYHIGFSYLMIHRFEDASNAFRRCVTVKLNGRRFSERVQQDAAYMYVCARVLGGMPINNLTSYLDSRKVAAFEDDRESLRTGDEERFRDVFDRCSPKFLTVPPSDGSPVKGSEGRELQARMFRRAVQQQQDIIKLRGYFKVYQNTKMNLLETLLEVDDGYAPLFALKMRSRQLVHDGVTADLLQGVFTSSSEFDCIVQDDNVEVVPSMTFGGIEQKLLNKIKNTQRDIEMAKRKFNQTRNRDEGGNKRRDQRDQKRRPNQQQLHGGVGNNAGSANRNNNNANRYPRQKMAAQPMTSNLFNRNDN
ncbi:EIF3-interacting protein-like protein [Leishmania infantum JPCM5]|uniref:Eukaryotic translation initiation factor 3 subunit L n=3 Tax=Leishmania donovani species complex TaxID=38574 RepID=A0A6L0Y1B1_LEIIN|nr:EIF3-interacting protein-like protein [Leishmania infantum JPCM5]XP_003865144.1 EIF3-interacting protein-like protein [Leishmania donovani]CAC9548628.1 eukaryotic_translation_initiation_factor_3_subunit_L_-_putative [Leishmania infantum]AYU83370.1 eukaryotic translation initiation factor 3 subunit L, putative [Leishmania donovani]TPP48144.1 RNA polymerase I-associated factor PAF67 family protein [Leishmania donovani]CAM72691.1 EIF3-interacting protein-like protein [Leishmania infantum JPCM5|eukprot:XP_001469581.1 EIF3-interacting protein-like protein [Leishmania infantum JPCM5]